MTLAPGSRLSNYHIIALIGAGGMGEVYRARDERLQRDVALKILPEDWARDPERIARLEREARALASVNHPHIAGIHEFAQSGSSCFLVLELVEGETLASRIAQGSLATAEALRIARQIIGALDAAHEKGIIHRDLKPANIMLTADGSVKVLDFGLAKLATDATGTSPTSTMTNSPTVIASTAGMILGTAAYMAPEQATGKAVDKRIDIWAFGLIVYEMLTGRSPFRAATVQETMAAVLKEEPDLSTMPEQVQPLLRQCLVKDPKHRLRDIGDAALLLDRMRPAKRIARARWLWPAVTAALAIVTAVAIWAPWRRPLSLEPIRFPVPMPENGSFTGSLGLSPDGRRLVFSARGKDGFRRLWLREMSSPNSRAIPGTELDSEFAGSLSWAPDNRFIAFSDGNLVKKVDVSGSNPPVTIATLPNLAGSSSWNSGGVILVGGITSGPIWRVPEAGGEPTAVTMLGQSEMAHGFPSFLPDGRHFLYLRNGGAATGTYVGSLDVTPQNQSDKRLLASDSRAVYVPPSGSEPGRVIFVRQRRLLAQSFDPAGLAFKGEAVLVVPSIGRIASRALYDMSPDGTLVYSGGSEYQFNWVDRKTLQHGEPVADASTSSYASVAPNSSRVVFDQIVDNGVDIWLTDASRGILKQLSFNPARDEYPILSSDASRVVFRSDRGGAFDLYETKVDGTGGDRLLLHSDHDKWPGDWSHDSKYVIYEERTDQEDLWVVATEGDSKPIPLTRTRFAEKSPQFSRDDRWIAYQSNQTGRWEVYVQPFVPSAAGAVNYQVSHDGGQRPLWGADSKELVYITANGNVVAVDVTTTPQIQTGSPRELFRMPAQVVNFPRLQMSGDAQRFLVTAPVADSSGAITVVTYRQAVRRRD